MKFFVFIILMSCNTCIAHTKWAKAEFTDNGKISLTYSESLVPFIPERRLIKSSIRIKRDGKTADASSYIEKYESTSVSDVAIIKNIGNIDAILIESNPVIKRPKIDRKSGKYLPLRVEYNRLSVLLGDASSSTKIKPSDKLLEVMPVFEESGPSKANKKYAIQVYRNGKITNAPNPIIYNSTDNNYITKFTIKENGLVEFVPNSPGLYIFQVDELALSPGHSTDNKVGHIHMFASLIFEVKG